LRAGVFVTLLFLGYSFAVITFVVHNQ